jgi:hypothetical protein
VEKFSLKIGPAHEGKSWVAVYVGTRGCLGDIDGQATVRGDVLEFASDDGGDHCRLTIHRSATGATIAERNCAFFHGLSCSFDTGGETLHALAALKPPVAAASVAQAGTKQMGWKQVGWWPNVAPNGAASATGFADDGFSSILFACSKSTALDFILDPRGYRGHALRKILDLDQPFILEVRPVSGETQKFPLIAYMAGDGAWPTGRNGQERGLTGSAATAFLDAFGREGRMSLQTGEGVELAAWTLKDMSKVRELMRNTCQL